MGKEHGRDWSQPEDDALRQEAIEDILAFIEERNNAKDTKSLVALVGFIHIKFE